MTTYVLTLHKTYYNRGFFNIPVDFDRFVRSKGGPMQIWLGDRSSQAKVNRTANKNSTARIMGGVPLREWFQSEFSKLDSVNVEFSTPESIRLSPRTSRPILGKYQWSQLNHLQVGRFAEYLVKMELTQYGLDVYSSEVDDRGIDFIVRLSSSLFADIQVKAVRGLSYIFLPKRTFHPRENLFAAVVLLQDGQPPDQYLVPSMEWMTADSLLVSRNYEEAASDPEWGINLSKKNMELLDRYRLEESIRSLIESAQLGSA